MAKVGNRLALPALGAELASPAPQHKEDRNEKVGFTTPNAGSANRSRVGVLEAHLMQAFPKVAVPEHEHSL
jgi:hypothetical protein